MDVGRCWVSSGGQGGAAIACIELAGPIDDLLAALGVRGVAVGEARRRSVPVGGGIRDDAVVVRWTPDRATVMTHGGVAVVDGLLAACTLAGVRIGAERSRTFVESEDDIEGLMLAALATARSPIAVDLLLDQPRRWRMQRDRALATAERSPRDAALRRLIEPALVVAVGPPNVGKSSLLNALAGRGVSAVADEPGTTRDHVGALIDLGGVVVRWVDTPGLGGNTDLQIQAEAQRTAAEVASAADVLVVCGDAHAALDRVPVTKGAIVRVALRADLSGGPLRPTDATVSVKKGVGLEGLVAAVREAVVPARWIEDGEPWRFW